MSRGAHFRTVNGKSSKKKYSGMKKCDNVATTGIDGSLLNGKEWETDFLNTRHTENSLRYYFIINLILLIKFHPLIFTHFFGFDSF